MWVEKGLFHVMYLSERPPPAPPHDKRHTANKKFRERERERSRQILCVVVAEWAESRKSDKCSIRLDSNKYDFGAMHEELHNIILAVNQGEKWIKALIWAGRLQKMSK